MAIFTLHCHFRPTSRHLITVLITRPIVYLLHRKFQQNRTMRGLLIAIWPFSILWIPWFWRCAPMFGR